MFNSKLIMAAVLSVCLFTGSAAADSFDVTNLKWVSCWDPVYVAQQNMAQCVEFIEYKCSSDNNDAQKWCELYKQERAKLKR